MPWYKSGTVSVVLNSNAVIGTGTAFIANSRVGDAFRGPDGGWYEVTNIASDTALSISPNYQGATNAAGVYALAPMQGYVKDSADALRALVNQFGAQLAALTDADGLPEGATNKYFTDARGRGTVLQGLVTTDEAPVVSADTVLAGLGKLQAQVTARLPLAGGKMIGAVNDATPVALASAATVDIGAAASNVVTISGTTPITGLGNITAGARRTVRFLAALVLTHNATSLILPAGANIATAANDTAEFLSLGGGNWICIDYQRANGKPIAFAFDRSNSVGTVSQVSGIPTGAIIEQCSNVNGRFAKFADGTMICWYYGATNYAINSATGTGLFNSAVVGFTFPATFSVNSVFPVVTPSAISPAGYYSWAATYVSTPNVNNCALVLVSPSGAATAFFSYIAIGRWF